MMYTRSRSSQEANIRSAKKTSADVSEDVNEEMGIIERRYFGDDSGENRENWAAPGAISAYGPPH